MAQAVAEPSKLADAVELVSHFGELFQQLLSGEASLNPETWLAEHHSALMKLDGLVRGTVDDADAVADVVHEVDTEIPTKATPVNTDPTA